MRFGNTLLSCTAVVFATVAAGGNRRDLDESFDEDPPVPESPVVTADYQPVLARAAEPVSEEQKQEYDRLATVLQTNYLCSWPIPVEQIPEMLPIGPGSYPESLQGLLWMDQAGYYGHSSVPTGGAPDSLLSFGETNFSAYDPNTHSIMMSTFCGGAWPTDGTVSGIDKRAGCGVGAGAAGTTSTGTQTASALRRFTFSDDLEMAYIDEWSNGTFLTTGYIPVMHRQHPPTEGSCPPSNDATKRERSLCAKWIRQSFPPGDTNLTGRHWDYSVFEIVGQDGVKIEPYFSAYVEAMHAVNSTYGLLGVWVD